MPRIEPFETHGEVYDDWFERYKGIYVSELKAMRLLLPSFQRGVEVGIGTGRFAAPLGIREGVEPSPKLAEVARQRGLRVVEGVAEHLPFPDASFDLVLFVTTICFVDDLSKSFQESYRVLIPGGFILVGMVDRESHLGKIYEAKKGENVFYRHATFYTTSEVVNLLYKAGFKDFNFAQTIFGDLHTGPQEEDPRFGFGEGSFVVIRAQRR
ncbi:MAG: Methyltransferase [Hydrogenibacillus schlegelii]|uniref:Methyltransferase n=1 Tax=Hydrogenibacillus schlegelii TaxID=1484 RepID=A0A2T5G3J9_HYDSH|nr:class I SAM-dependent methyltransferase [Hydrogenibacillus schlegelii]PTQ50741.1 MAG: Methyltransferase [Hydrogenibacillus schlegelii]